MVGIVRFELDPRSIVDHGPVLAQIRQILVDGSPVEGNQEVNFVVDCRNR